MRKMLGFCYVVQAVCFAAVLAILVKYHGVENMPFLHEQASVGLYLIILIGLFISIPAIGYVFGKSDIKNDGKLAMLVAQAFLVTLVLLHGSFDLSVVALPAVCGFAYWRTI